MGPTVVGENGGGPSRGCGKIQFRGVARRAIRPSPKDASGRRCERRGSLELESASDGLDEELNVERRRRTWRRCRCRLRSRCGAGCGELGLAPTATCVCGIAPMNVREPSRFGRRGAPGADAFDAHVGSSSPHSWWSSPPGADDVAETAALQPGASLRTRRVSSSNATRRRWLAIVRSGR